LIGIYEEKWCVETIRKKDQKTSDVLPLIFETLMKEWDIAALYYAKGPGSFMSIKVAYIFLKSLSVLCSIPLFAADAFYFNGNAPVKAVGKLYFVKIANKIQTVKLDSKEPCEFTLPQILNSNDFDTQTVPEYSIEAVY
jgi:tRNA A37 threonylcarbamoyladenosine modification protein TsaB